MKALVTAWVVSLAVIIGGGVFLLNYQQPVVEARQAEPLTITKVDKAPTLSTGPMAFDPTKTPEEIEEEDCPSSC